MIDKLVIVEYVEGAGGEFISSFISAHWGHEISINLQKTPNQLQKWFNTNSLMLEDWDKNFEQHVKTFAKLCVEKNVSSLAVPYHLHHWPHHYQVLRTLSDNTRFVRINSDGYENRIAVDFKRKVSNRILDRSDFGLIQLWLKDRPQDHRRRLMNLFRQKRLTLADISLKFQIPCNRILPIVSDDVVISYEDFFIDFTKTNKAYHQLCFQLDLMPDQKLLAILLDRNRKNLEEQNLLLD